MNRHDLGCLAVAITSYLASEHFAGLAPATQRTRPYSGPYSPKPSGPPMVHLRRCRLILHRCPILSAPPAQHPGAPRISAGTGEPREPRREGVLPRVCVEIIVCHGACRTHAALSSPLTATADDCVPLGNSTGEFTIAGAPAVRH